MSFDVFCLLADGGFAMLPAVRTMNVASRFSAFHDGRCVSIELGMLAPNCLGNPMAVNLQKERGFLFGVEHLTKDTMTTHHRMVGEEGGRSERTPLGTLGSTCASTY